MATYKNCKDNEKRFFEQHYDGQLLPDSKLCRRHKLEAERHTSETSYVPMWKDKGQVRSTPCYTCVYSGCKTTNLMEKLIKPTFASETKIQQLHAINTTSPLLLCQIHYCHIYNHYAAQTCKSCGATPKKGKRFIHHSPDSDRISVHLSTATGNTVTITQDDFLCTPCFNTHLSIIKSLNEAPTFYDETLKYDIQKWQDASCGMTNGNVSNAVLKTVILLANLFLENKALLLPKACKIFLEFYGLEIENSYSVTSVELQLDTEDGTVKFSSRWMLTQLLVYLSPYMLYKCVIRKYGIVLYRKGGDLLATVSHCLGKATYDSNDVEEFNIQNADDVANGKWVTLTKAGEIINDLIHKEIANVQSSFDSNDPLHFNVEESINKIDPLLLHFINIATRTKRERHSLRLAPATEISKQTKKIRQYFLLVLFFSSTNLNVIMPIQNVLADVVETCGGSRQLIKILNKFGITSSSDTHDQLVADRARYQRERSVWSDMPSNVFTIASTDNFDMLQSYAAVYHGTLKRSYHGTTIELMQPRPSLKLPLLNLDISTVQSGTVQSIDTISSVSYSEVQSTQSNTVPHSTDTAVLSTDIVVPCTVQGYAVRNTPLVQHTATVLPICTDTVVSTAQSNTMSLCNTCSSLPCTVQCTSTVSQHTSEGVLDRHAPQVHSLPFQQQKKAKRRRTVCVQKPIVSIQPKEKESVEVNKSLTLCDFKISEKEKEQLEALKLKSFFYNTIKVLVHTEIEGTYLVNDFRLFLPVSNDSKIEPSTVYYLELLDEHPDTDEAMLLVAEDLLEKFQNSQKYVILVGDGKTYQRLSSIKQKYGSALDKILTFPGDWHTLKNYQSVLIKVYYSAGLKELAMNSGYRAQTLKSIESASSFKRTHNFIMQAWEAIYRRMLGIYNEYKRDGTVMDIVIEKLKVFFTQSDLHVHPRSAMQEIESLLSRSDYNEFIEFVELKSSKDSMEIVDKLCF